jgi:hypothetical protein
MENKGKASEFFHGKEGYNCAQAVLRAKQEEYGISQEMIDDHVKYGGGRAEGGVCGALYAAKKLTPKPIEEKFEEKAGSTKCREIKAQGKFSCVECVDLAGEILNG